MKRPLWFICWFAWIVAPLAAVEAIWDTAALSVPPRLFPPPEAFAVSPQVQTLPEGVTAVVFEGLPWRGKPTRVFAYYGVPKSASAEAKVPGIVLVHGAGGTAFADWVKLWLDRGYAAIAFDHDGGIPVGKYSAWERQPEGGPRRADVAQLKWPVADQWMYHAVADTMLAHSLLASLPGVDTDRIGATGISWGGVILCNAAGVDARLKFAVPVYGCGFVAEEDADGSAFVGQKGTAEQRAEWSALWDPRNFLPRARVPMLWLNGTNDFAFTMKAWGRSYRAAPETRGVCLRVGMKHGHNGPGESPEEIRAFADSLVKGGAPLLRISGQGAEDGAAWVSFAGATALKRAELNYTTDGGRWQDRVWRTIPVTVENGRVVAKIPEGATVYFFNLIDERGLIVSSAHEEVAP